MADRLIRVVSQIFNVPVEEVSDDSSPDTVRKWDSLQHMNLVMALEAEFGVSLTPEEAMEMLSVKLIRLTLEERGVAI